MAQDPDFLSGLGGGTQTAQDDFLQGLGSEEPSLWDRLTTLPSASEVAQPFADVGAGFLRGLGLSDYAKDLEQYGTPGRSVMKSVNEGIGQLAPAMAAAPLGSTAILTTMGAQAGVQGYHQAREEGASTGEALLSGSEQALVGVVAGKLGSIMPGLQKLAQVAQEAGPAVSLTFKDALSGGTKLGLAVGQQAVVGAGQTWANDMIAKETYGATRPVLEDVLSSLAPNAILAGLIHVAIATGDRLSQVRKAPATASEQQAQSAENRPGTQPEPVPAQATADTQSPQESPAPLAIEGMSPEAHQALGFTPPEPVIQENAPNLEQPAANEGELQQASAKPLVDRAITGIKNAVVDAEREQRGVEPIESPGGASDVTLLSQARDSLAKDPFAGERLVDELSKSTRNPTDEENMLLDVHKRTVTNLFEDVASEMSKEQATGAPDEARLSDLRAQRDNLFSQLDRIDQVTKETGTAAGRAFRIRKLMLDQDYSLASMLLKRQAVNDGKPLTEETIKEITEIRDKLREVEEKLKTDPTSESLRSQQARLRQKFDLGIHTERLAQRTKFEKTLDALAAWRRFGVLSWPTTIVKLATATMERVAIAPLEEAVGRVIVPKKVAALAPREGGFSWKAESKAITEGTVSGMRDAYQTVKTGKSDIKAINESIKDMPVVWTEYAGRIHEALKSPARRNEYARALQKRLEFYGRQGLDMHDPAVQIRASFEAFKDSNRAVFNQDAKIVKAWDSFIRTLESKDPKTGKPAMTGKALAVFFKTLLPIVKIPTNIAIETGNYAAGVPIGTMKLLLHAFEKGSKDLTPEQADSIARHLKKGALGAAVALWGYYNADKVGGYYQKGKRDDKDVKFGTVRIAGVNIPSLVIHNPLLEVAQIGATIRRVSDAILAKGGGNSEALRSGMVEAAMGLAEEIPFVRETEDIAKMREPGGTSQTGPRTAASVVVPGIVQWLAQITDSAEGRKPQGYVENLEAAVPGLRQKVPEKKPKKVTPYQSQFVPQK